MDNFIQTVLTLFIILDPIGLSPIIQSLLKGYSSARQKVIIIRELCFTLGILLVFFFSGEPLLKWLGLQDSTLSISGGILLFLVALGMVFPAKTILASGDGKKEEQGEPFIVPIAMPLMAGPSSLAMVMLYAAQSKDSLSMWTYAGAIITTVILCACVLFIARKFLRKLGEKGTMALERMMGMLLILISVQMFMNGLFRAMQQLN